MVNDSPSDDRADREPLQSPASREVLSADRPSRDDGILTPEELAQTRRELRELDEGRAVVPTDADVSPETDEDTDGQSPTGDIETQEAVGQESDPKTGAHSMPTHEFGLDVAVTESGSTAEATFTSNDIRVVFADFLRWYAGEIEPSRPPEEVLATLITASEFDLECR
jgi:hypothetical protein